MCDEKSRDFFGENGEVQGPRSKVQGRGNHGLWIMNERADVEVEVEQSMKDDRG